MNAFLAANRGRIRTYFDRLVDVPDLSLREMRIEKYLRTLRTEAQQRFVAISLNELYFMHRLLLRPVHADALKHAVTVAHPPPSQWFAPSSCRCTPTSSSTPRPSRRCAS